VRGFKNFPQPWVVCLPGIPGDSCLFCVLEGTCVISVPDEPFGHQEFPWFTRRL